MNIEIENFRLSLISLLNSCNLPVGTAFYVMKDVYNLLAQKYEEILREEKNMQTHDTVEVNIVPKEDTNNSEMTEEIIIYEAEEE